MVQMARQEGASCRRCRVVTQVMFLSFIYIFRYCQSFVRCEVVTLNMRNKYAWLSFQNRFQQRQPLLLLLSTPASPLLHGHLHGLLGTHLSGAQRGPLSHRRLPSPWRRHPDTSVFTPATAALCLSITHPPTSQPGATLTWVHLCWPKSTSRTFQNALPLAFPTDPFSGL